MTVRVTRNKITPSLGRIQARFDTLPKRAFQEWRKLTPRRTGNAKRKTKLQRSVINASYPYAERLDSGYSRQAPQGMWEPTKRFIERITRRMVRK